ncbi:hypothetical protein JW879_10740 [candidate division WOR-3 bacterium]|nr:hypothetical protein [candidate division WOR-3 bacterium]
MIFLFVSSNQMYGKTKEPEKVLSASAEVHISWSIDRGKTTNKGHLNLKLNGVMELNQAYTKEVKTKEISSFFPFLTYEPQTMIVQYEYAESLMDNEKEKCPPLKEEYVGNGTFSLGGDPGSVSRASLYIRKIASMIPVDKFSGSSGFCDYYEFFAAAEEVTVRGRVRKSDCTYETDEKDINLCKLGIRFQIPEDGRMTNSREWSTKTQTGSPPFKITVSDLPPFMGEENFHPENIAGGDVNYSVNWAFGEVDLVFLYIMRKVNGNWEDIEDNDELTEVVVGEKVELKGVVVPKEKDPKKGDWVIDGNNNQNYIKQFKVADDQSKSEVIPIKDEDLKQPEIGFYWYKGNKGNVKYTATVDGKQHTKDAEFTIRKPDYTVICDSSRPGNSFGVMKGGDPKLLNQWPKENRVDPKYEGKLDEKKELVGLQYNGILFLAEPLSDISGETQWVQIVDNCQLIQEYISDGRSSKTPPIDQNCKKGLDRVYPCARNNSFYDAPGIPTNILAENVTYLRSRMTFDLYFMFKPKKELSEWVPLKLINWKWDGDVQKVGKEWKAAECHNFVPKAKEYKGSGEAPTVTDAAEYPLWDQIVKK